MYIYTCIILVSVPMSTSKQRRYSCNPRCSRISCATRSPTPTVKSYQTLAKQKPHGQSAVTGSLGFFQISSGLFLRPSALLQKNATAPQETAQNFSRRNMLLSQPSVENHQRCMRQIKGSFRVWLWFIFGAFGFYLSCEKEPILTLCTHKSLSRILLFYFRSHDAGFRETTATTTSFADLSRWKGKSCNRGHDSWPAETFS